LVFFSFADEVLDRLACQHVLEVRAVLSKILRVSVDQLLNRAVHAVAG
jgi:hypothetical protein